MAACGGVVEEDKGSHGQSEGGAQLHCGVEQTSGGSGVVVVDLAEGESGQLGADRAQPEPDEEHRCRGGRERQVGALAGDQQLVTGQGEDDQDRAGLGDASGTVVEACVSGPRWQTAGKSLKTSGYRAWRIGSHLGCGRADSEKRADGTREARKARGVVHAKPLAGREGPVPPRAAHSAGESRSHRAAAGVYRGEWSCCRRSRWTLRI